MKRFLRKHFIVIFAVLAALCLGAAFALLSDGNRVTANAETPASPCDGTADVLTVPETVASTEVTYALVGTVADCDGGAHSYGEWSVTIEVTCTQKGEKKRTCSVCGATQTEEVAALGHSYSTDYTTDVAPNCTQKGERSRHCSRCDDRTDVAEMPAYGHSYGEWTEAKPATKDGDGEEKRTCSVCGDALTRAVKYEPTTTKSLLWLIIVLAVIVAAEAVVLALRIRAKTKGGKDEKTGAYLPLLAAAYPTGEIVAIAVLAAAAVVMGVAIACTFIKKKKPYYTAPYAAPSYSDEVAVTEYEQPAEEEPLTYADNDDEELENEMAEELESDEEESGISLKESLALAAAYSQIKINKKSVAEWLKNNYGNEVQLNCRANKTKTGLPLADTHYVTVGAKKKCFAYVYELDDEKSMLLLKTDDDTAKAIAAKYSTFVKSRFPKARREKWFTLIPDGGFNSSDEVFDVLALILSKYTENLRKVSEEVRSEIAQLGELKKSDVTAEEAKVLVSDAAAAALITGARHRKTGKKFAVNIDTLSENFQADDTVDIDALKEKGIVPRSAKLIKILARGTLDKPLVVIADDFSVDAVKMIVLTGGEALWA